MKMLHFSKILHFSDMVPKIQVKKNTKQFFVFHKVFIYQVYFIDFLERCKNYAITDLVSVLKNYMFENAFSLLCGFPSSISLQILVKILKWQYEKPDFEPSKNNYIPSNNIFFSCLFPFSACFTSIEPLVNIDIIVEENITQVWLCWK